MTAGRRAIRQGPSICCNAAVSPVPLLGRGFAIGWRVGSTHGSEGRPLHGPHAHLKLEDTLVLWAIVAILLVLWLLGLLGSIGGGLIHILLVIALVVVVVQLLSGRRAV